MLLKFGKKHGLSQSAFEEESLENVMRAQKVIAAGLIAALICCIIAASLCFGAASKPTPTTLRLRNPSLVAGFTNLLLAGVTGILLYLILAVPLIPSCKGEMFCTFY